MKKQGVKLLRVEKGLTQTEAGKILGIGVQAYAAREGDIELLSLKEINTIREFYELDDEQAVEIFFTPKVVNTTT